MLLGQQQGVAAQRGLQDPVAIVLQDLDGQPADILLILDHHHCFGAAQRAGRRRRGLGGRGGGAPAPTRGR